MEKKPESTRIEIEYSSNFSPDECLLTFGEAGRLTKKSTPTLYRDVKANRFPKFIKVGGRSYFLKSEILNYLSNCVKQREKGGE